MKLSELPQGQVRWLVMGASGTGKTRLIGSLCGLMPTVVLTADKGGLATLRTMKAEPQSVHLLEDWSRVWDAYGAIKTEAAPGTALAVDDLGALEQLLERRISLQPRGAEERLRPIERDEKARRELMSGARRIPYDQRYEITIGIDALLEELYQLPYSLLVVTVLEDTARSPRTGKQHLYPALQPSIGRRLAAEFGLVLSLFVATDGDGAVHWCATTRPHPHVETKDRFGTPRTWIGPDAQRLLAHVGGQDRGGELAENEAERKLGTGTESKQ